MKYIARWQAFGVTGETAEKLMKISPASIDRYLKKDKDSLKSRIPIRAFYTGKERSVRHRRTAMPGFWQIDTGGLQSDTIAARPPGASTSIL
jgi:hypothetical protein